MDAANALVTGKIGIKLYKGSARVVTRSSANAVYDAQLASFAESGGLFSQAASPGSSSSGPCSRGWPGGCATKASSIGLMGYKLLGFIVWQGGKWYLRRRVSALAARWRSRGCPRPSSRV